MTIYRSEMFLDMINDDGGLFESEMHIFVGFVRPRQSCWSSFN